MRWTAALCAALLIGCGAGGDEPVELPGETAVYERIGALDDCGELQHEFDQAMSNAEAREPGDELRKVSRSYAEAADERMREVGCYDS